MKTRTVISILLATLAPGQLCLGATSTISRSKSATLFPEWKISAEIPKPYLRYPLPASDTEPYFEVFISGGYAYTVEVVKTPAKTLASTYIEQTIQANVKSSASKAKRWELQSRQGELFKGVTAPYQLATPYPGALQKMLGGSSGVQCIAMAPLHGEASPVLKVGVISKSADKAIAENRAKAFAAMIVLNADIAAAKPLQKSAPKTKPTSVDANPVVAIKPVPDQSAEVVVKPVPEPKPVQEPVLKPVVKPAPKPVKKPTPARANFLRKGEIELIGLVKSVDEAQKTLVFTVSQIRLPGSDMQARDPAADKSVRFRSMPKGVKVGSRISVIGKNLGIGKPITADVISLVGVD